MKLWIGGACQGKSRLAYEDTKKMLGGAEPVVADGDRDTFEAALNADLILHMHEFIRRLERDEKDSMEFVQAVITGEPEAVVMDEVGYGIVPVEAEARHFREAAGRAGQCLAAHADTVYRVMCGIAAVIKEKTEQE